MFSLNKDSVIYVVCPYFYKTGGTELTHQLVYTITQLGGNAKIAYFWDGKSKKEIHPEFFKYVNTFVDFSQINDDRNNVVVLPEICPTLAKHLKKIQKCVWWMSVDNFLVNDSILYSIRFRGFLRTVKHLIFGLVRIKKYKFDDNVINLYQSEYAHEFLLSHKVKHCYRLSDYLNSIYLSSSMEFLSNKRKDIVLYNPSKGYKFTKLIIQSSPDIHWVAIKNLKTNEVYELLNVSKIYIDFGNHPGKDRFPREAAMCGCCVITGKRGSAKYYEDVSIPNKYKFEDKKENIHDIVKLIRSCLIDYDVHIQDFSEYRRIILGEKELFCNDVKQIFVNCSTNIEQ